ncbi:TPA_asm: hypothetical protein [Porphyromonas phage phage024a_F0570]|uniref:Uncharacterized protein n=1 Tax=Porphyromonas phage phage024a_F0570 TaxID=3154114 RepID=A0AAT9JD47_9CAUD
MLFQKETIYLQCNQSLVGGNYDLPLICGRYFCIPTTVLGYLRYRTPVASS